MNVRSATMAARLCAIAGKAASFPALRVECLALVLVGLNYADYAVTIQSVLRGAAEANILIIALGGPFAVLPTMLKLVLVPILAGGMVLLSRMTQSHRRAFQLMSLGAILFYVTILVQGVIVLWSLPDVCLL